MQFSPKAIALTAAGTLVVVGAAIAAPTIGDMLAPPATAGQSIVGGEVEYAVNAAGETFGSPANGEVPDLIPAAAENGEFGYVRVTELDQQRNLARSSADPAATFAISVYLSDGETVIGELAITKDTPGPRDGFRN
ncbi:MAG TPA: hypothetical protein VFM95_02945 [Microcella sp.]|nr:hypothetical protein [Microcella sp.]